MNPFSLEDHARIPLSQDAALVAALAGTAMPFAHSAEDQAERWLRAIRLHGRVGEAMQALGIGEAPLMTRAEPPAVDDTTAPAGDVAARAVSIAGSFAAERDASCVGTLDLLFALFEIYGGLIDRALYLRGASKDELLARLAAMEPAESSF
ncbi:MAG: hypothetical protein WKF29_06195 [Thermoleophilaceae bacterium]